jgi:flagellar motility protein MotE (MotC chaperone)
VQEEEKKTQEAENSEETPETVTQKKKLKIPRAVWIVVGWLGSFLLVFAMIWAYISFFETNKIVPAEVHSQQEGIAKDSTTVPMYIAAVDSTDSTEVASTIEDHDSTEASIMDVSTINTQNDSVEEAYIESLLADQVAVLRDRLIAKTLQVKELTNVLEERDHLSKENEELKQKSNKQNEELDLYRNQLPKAIANELSKMQTANEGNRSASASSAGANVESGDAIKKVAKMFEAMKPAEAATILSQLKEKEIIQILMNMKQREAARVLTSLDPSLAAKITRQLSLN